MSISIQAPPKKIPLVHRMISKKPVNTDSIEAMTAEKDKKVTGTFVNVECPGQPAKVCCKLYKEQPYFEQVFEDGQTYTIPLSVARFINERIHYQPHTFILNEKGESIKSEKTIARYKFMANF